MLTSRAFSAFVAWFKGYHWASFWLLLGVELLEPSEIATEIDRNLDFLAVESRDLSERQRSLRAVFEHSWRLLSEEEQTIFQQLSVFRGGFNREAAQEVAQASLPRLMGLSHRSLLERTRSGRFEIHELLRQYAAEKLKASTETYDATRNRHVAHFARVMQQRETDLKGSRQLEALTLIEAEVENARFAINWATEHRLIDDLHQLIDGLGLFYEIRGRFQEGQAVFKMIAGRSR